MTRGDAPHPEAVTNMSKIARALVGCLLLGGCKLHMDDGVDLGEDMVAAASSPDLGDVEDLRRWPDPDLAPPPDLTLCPDVVVSQACAGPRTVCTQQHECTACGGDGQPCCPGAMAQFCGDGLRCVGCNPGDWGVMSRCQSDDCGFAGKSCCWTWSPFTGPRCGQEPARELCFAGQGSCVDHRCAK